MFYEVQGLRDRFLTEIMDADAAHGDRKSLFFQPFSAAVGAGTLAHALLQLPAHTVALGFPVAALQIVHHAFERLVQGPLPVAALVGQLEFFPLGAVEDPVQDLRGQLFHRRAELEAVLFGQGVKVHAGDGIALDVVPAGGGDGPLQDGELFVGEDEVRVHLQLCAQSGAGGAGAVGIVEGKHAGREFLNGDAAVLTGIILGKQDITVLVHDVDDDQAARQGGGGLHTVGQAAGDVLPDDQPVHDHFDVVLPVLVQLDLLAQVIQGSVHPYPDITGLAGVLKELLVFPLPGAHHGGEHLYPGGFGQGHHLVDDLVDGLLLNLLAALGAVGRAYPGPQKAQIVVDLGDGTHGGAGVFGGGLLVDGNGGGQAVDIVHVGLLHLTQEHAGVGAEGLHVPALALGINGLKGQGGLAASGYAGEHHQLVPRNLHVDVFQIVFPCAFDVNVVEHNRWVLLCDDSRPRRAGFRSGIKTDSTTGPKAGCRPQAGRQGPAAAGAAGAGRPRRAGQKTAGRSGRGPRSPTVCPAAPGRAQGRPTAQ